MEVGEKISEELIEEVLSVVFSKKVNLDKVNLVLRYNQAYLEGLNPNPKPNLIPKFNSNFISLNSRKNRAYNLGSKLRGFREEIHCHFCGEMGHNKKSCVRKQTYDHTKRNRFNHPIPTQTLISFDQEFLETARGLTQLRNPQITLEELIRIRTIGNTLIYYYPI